MSEFIGLDIEGRKEAQKNEIHEGFLNAVNNVAMGHFVMEGELQDKKMTKKMTEGQISVKTKERVKKDNGELKKIVAARAKALKDAGISDWLSKEEVDNIVMDKIGDFDITKPNRATVEADLVLIERDMAKIKAEQEKIEDGELEDLSDQNAKEYAERYKFNQTRLAYLRRQRVDLYEQLDELKKKNPYNNSDEESPI